MPDELSQDRLRDLYDAYVAQHVHAPWFDAYLAEVQHFRQLSEENLRTATEQERLWRARGIANLGPGEAMTTQAAYPVPELAQAFVELRARPWPTEPNARAQSLQRDYDQLLDLVHPAYAPRKPQTKLGRAFAALVPEHTTTCLNYNSGRELQRLVLGRRLSHYEGNALARARLRSVLGDEGDDAEHVRRSMFCWWLFEHRDAVARGDTPTRRETPETRAGDDEPDAPPTAPKLVFEPTPRLYRGMTSVGGQLELFRTMLRESAHGATEDDLVDAAGTHTNLADSTLRMLFRNLRNLGFLRHHEGLWYPSDDGDELLETDPPEVLIERLLTRVFGPAHVIRILGTGPLTIPELAVQLRAVYPRWTANTMASDLCAFLESLGLVESQSGYTRAITEYGTAWAERLPEELPIPDVEPAPVVLPPVPAPPDRVPTLAQILEAMRADPELSKLVFRDDQIGALHWAWHCDPRHRKRFVLLSGLSGTGKTALLRGYAQVYATLYGVDPDVHRSLVAVSPDWRDPSGLLGYLNRLHADPSFHPEPALRLVLEAVANPGWPYFLILDEMNLARVERYFAPFLSAMETGDDLVLHAHDREANDVPPRVPWPQNLFIGGTVNMDETTHPFSDKVLDRAFTLEFYEVDLPAFFERRNVGGGPRDTALESLLQAVHDHLRPIRRHFGYRTAGEVLDFVSVAVGQGGNAPDVTDQALFSKVLPRLRGEQTQELDTALNQLVQLCEQNHLVRCKAKLEGMQRRLRAVGVTGFWS